MRSAEFPFPLVRETMAAPDVVPDVPQDGLRRFGDFLERVKLPILDEDLNKYKISPVTRRGLYNYTGYNEAATEIKHLLNDGPTKAIDKLLLAQDRAREVLHVAESAERSLAFFSLITLIRARALERALDQFGQHYVVRDNRAALWSADAITDIGYCMQRPANLPKPGTPNAKYSTVLADAVWGFGAYAGERDESVLSTADGYSLMLFAADEQKRRLPHFMDRYRLVVDEFGVQAPDSFVPHQISDDELLDITF